ncbi:hypothetical protein D9M68_679860 [compost metagenome]
MGLPDQSVQLRQYARGHTQPLQLQAPGFLVQQAQHGAFAVPGGQGRHAHVYRPPPHPQGDAAVLRQTLFGDVQVRHDLDARNQRRVQRLARRHDVAQGAIHPVAHHRMGLERLDVDVAGAIARRLREERIDHADHGRVVLRFQQVRNLRHVLQQAVEVDLVLGHPHDRRRVLGMAVGGRQQGFERLVVYLGQNDVAVAAPDLPDRPVGRARADRQLRPPSPQRQHRALRAGPGVGQGMRAHSCETTSLL